MVTLRIKELNQPELWKTTLKHKNLFSLTSKILGSYVGVLLYVKCQSEQ